MTTAEQMATILHQVMITDKVSQAELARRAGVSAKHVNQVLNLKATGRIQQLDYWAYLLGWRFTVGLESIE